MNTKLLVVKKFFFSLLFSFFSVIAWSQTNPAAFNLSGGNFSFTSQTATSTTYPTSIQGWNNGGTANLATLSTTASTADISLTASATSTTAGIGNLGSNGFQFLSTGSSPNTVVGALALSLNTTGRKSITVGWTAQDQTTGSTRQMNLTLQYRVGTSGTFTTVSSSTYTTSNTSQAAAQVFSGITLPAACENQSVVQLRWLYYESASQSGSRDAIRLDEISVSSSAGGTVDGTITAGEYGTHTDGNNMQTTSTGTWYMTSDATNLYIGITGTNTTQGAIIYLDKNPIVPVNGGTNADGTLVGFNNYDGSNFANLQFRADLVVYFKDGYQEYRTSDGNNYWSTQTTTGMTYASASGTREIAIPWSAIGGKPASYNWFGYVAYTGGGAYASVPTENPGSGSGVIIGSSAAWPRYYTVSTTGTTMPFSRNSYTFTTSYDQTAFGSISCYDFTMNTSGRLISRSGNVSGNWTIGGDLVVGAGTIYLGSGGSGYGTTNIAGNLNILGGTFNMDQTTGAVSVTKNVSIASGASLVLSGTSGGDLYVAGNFTNNAGTGFNPNNRMVQFNGSGAAQSITGATTFDYLTFNNTFATAPQVTIANSIVVNKTLDFTKGIISLGANNITVGSSGSIANGSSTSFALATTTGKLIKQGVGNSAVNFPVGLSSTNYTPISITNTVGTSDVGVFPKTPVTNALSDATRALTLEWNVSSSAATTATIAPTWQSTNQGASFTNTGAGELGNYTTSYTTYPVTLSTTTTSGTGVALQNGTNYIVVGNTDSIKPPANDDCSGATALTMNATAITGTVKGATKSLATNPCTGTDDDDVWYKFTTTEPGNYVVTVVGASSMDAVVNLRSGACSGTSEVCADATAGGGTETITFACAANTTYYVRVFSFGSTVPSTPTFTIKVASPTPSITVNPTTINFGNVDINTYSTPNQSFTVSGSFLTPSSGSLTVAPPANYEVSIDNGTTWVANPSTASISYTSPLAATTVLIRFKPTAACTSYNGNIVVSGGGATSQNVAVTGTGVLPAPTANSATNITATSFDASWSSVSSATGYALDVSTNPNFGTSSSGTITENFESSTPSLPTAYQGTATNYTFGSGIWTLTDVIKTTTNQNSGTQGLQLKASTGTFTSPSFNSPTTLTFWAKRGASASTLVVNKVVGSTVTQLLSQALTTTFTQYTINVNDPSSNVQIQFVNGAAVSYVDDFVLNYNSVTPSYVSGYNNLAVSGTTQTVSGLSPNTTYYYRVRATNGSCASSNSNVVTVCTKSTAQNVNADGGTSTVEVCSGGTAEVSISNSEAVTSPATLSYQLYKDGSAVGSPVTGTGNSISFGQQGVGVYTIKATYANGQTSPNNCSSTTDMNNSVEVKLKAQVTFANIQYPGTGISCTGTGFDAFGQVKVIDGTTTLTGGSTALTNMEAEFGYKLSATDPGQPDNTWTWNAGTFNYPHIGDSSRDEYKYTFTPTTSGTYYYAFRFRYKGCDWKYGGYSSTGGGFWDGTNNVNGVLTVNPDVTAGTISGASPMLVGTTQTLTTNGTAGGTWSSSNTSVATINSSTGLVNAASAGTTTITYTVSSGCGSPKSTTFNLTVGDTTTWNGTSWDYGLPNENLNAVINANYTSSTTSSSTTAQDIVSKTLTVNNGFSLTVATDTSWTTGNFVNNGTLVVESDANFVQTLGGSYSGSGTSTVYRNAKMKRLDYTYWGGPVSGQNLKAFSPNTLTTRFYLYNEATDGFVSAGASTNSFVPAVGYAIRAPDNYTTTPASFVGTFNGTPNNGNYSFNLKYSLNGYNLIANPYPSNIDFDQLYSANSSKIGATAWFWTNNNTNPTSQGSSYLGNNYATYVSGTGGTPSQNGLDYPSGIIKVGQGFIIQAASSANNSALNFTNSLRTKEVMDNHNNSAVFFNSKNPNAILDRFWLRLTTPANNFNTILIGYISGATNGYDSTYDAPLITEGSDTFYSVIPSYKLAIQGRYFPLDNSDVVPLGSKNLDAGTYSISLVKKEGMFANGQNIYLNDLQTGIQTNLTTSSYSFQSTSGEFANRFEIVYLPKTSLATANSVKENVQVYKQGEDFAVTSQQNITDIELYDASGRLILTLKPNQTKAIIKGSGLANAMYVLKIKQNGEMVSKKIRK